MKKESMMDVNGSTIFLDLGKEEKSPKILVEMIVFVCTIHNIGFRKQVDKKKLGTQVAVGTKCDLVLLQSTRNVHSVQTAVVRSVIFSEWGI